MSVQERTASSPSMKIIWMPWCSVRRLSSSLSEEEVDIDAHLAVRASSILRAACMSMAHGAALSVAPMKPMGVSLLS